MIIFYVIQEVLEVEVMEVEVLEEVVIQEVVLVATVVKALEVKVSEVKVSEVWAAKGLVVDTEVDMEVVAMAHHMDMVFSEVV
jgi:hypothetical protein